MLTEFVIKFYWHWIALLPRLLAHRMSPIFMMKNNDTSSTSIYSDKEKVLARYQLKHLAYTYTSFHHHSIQTTLSRTLFAVFFYLFLFTISVRCIISSIYSNFISILIYSYISSCLCRGEAIASFPTARIPFWKISNRIPAK